MTLRGTTTFGSGQAVGVSSVSLAYPAGTVAGDVATVWLEAVSTGGATPTTPTGWTMETGPNLVGTTSSISFRYRKTLVSGDLPGPLVIALGGTMRALAAMVTESGVTTTGALSTVTLDTAATATPAFASVASVPASATVYGAMLRRSGGAVAFTAGFPAGSGFTTLASISTAYGSAAEATLLVGRQVAASSGTFGGGTASTTVTTTGTTMISALPVSAPTANAGADQTGKEPGETVTLTGTGDTWAQISGSPTVTLAGSGTTRTFTAPPTLTGTTLGFRNSQTGWTADDMTVAVNQADTRINIGGVLVPTYFRIV